MIFSHHKALLFFETFRKKNPIGFLSCRAAQVAFSRVDIEWKAAHPSLHLIKEATGSCKRATVWAMAADDHGGLMDKYLILERSGASVIETCLKVISFRR